MRLDRNTGNGDGKFAVLKLRDLRKRRQSAPHGLSAIDAAVNLLVDEGLLDVACDAESEFFVIRLKDKYSQAALIAYGLAAASDGEEEYARDIEQLAKRAGPSSPFCKVPD